MNSNKSWRQQFIDIFDFTEFLFWYNWSRGLDLKKKREVGVGKGRERKDMKDFIAQANGRIPKGGFNSVSLL